MTPTSSAWAGSGLSDVVQREIESIIARIPGVEEVILFGSRALGSARVGSDIDLAVRCTPGAAPYEVIVKLSGALNEETQLPYSFDVIALELTTHSDLLEHIQRFGKKVWPIDAVKQVY